MSGGGSSSSYSTFSSGSTPTRGAQSATAAESAIVSSRARAVGTAVSCIVVWRESTGKAKHHISTSREITLESHE